MKHIIGRVYVMSETGTNWMPTEKFERVPSTRDERAAMSSRERMRQALRESGRMKKVAGSYGRGLNNKWAREAAELISHRYIASTRVDAHGTFTLVGQPRRVWLAGISAQRGY